MVANEMNSGFGSVPSINGNVCQINKIRAAGFTKSAQGGSLRKESYWYHFPFNVYLFILQVAPLQTHAIVSRNTQPFALRPPEYSCKTG